MSNKPTKKAKWKTADEEIAEIKRSLDELLAAYQRNDEKRTYYWAGLVTHQMSAIVRKFMGLDPLKDGGSIVQPKKKIII